MSSIHLRALGHSYADDVYALKPTDLVFEHGKTYALLGPLGLRQDHHAQHHLRVAATLGGSCAL